MEEESRINIPVAEWQSRFDELTRRGSNIERVAPTYLFLGNVDSWEVLLPDRRSGAWVTWRGTGWIDAPHVCHVIHYVRCDQRGHRTELIHRDGGVWDVVAIPDGTDEVWLRWARWRAANEAEYAQALANQRRDAMTFIDDKSLLPRKGKKRSPRRRRATSAPSAAAAPTRPDDKLN